MLNLDSLAGDRQRFGLESQFHRAAVGPAHLDRRTVDLEQLAVRVSGGRDGGVNIDRLPAKLAVNRTDDDPRMIGARAVESDEVFSVQGKHGAIVGDGKFQHFFIGRPLFGFARLLDRHDIMAQTPQLLDNREGEVFVGVQLRHVLCLLILVNLLPDLLPMDTHIGPGVG